MILYVAVRSAGSSLLACGGPVRLRRHCEGLVGRAEIGGSPLALTPRRADARKLTALATAIEKSRERSLAAMARAKAPAAATHADGIARAYLQAASSLHPAAFSGLARPEAPRLDDRLAGAARAYTSPCRRCQSSEREALRGSAAPRTRAGARDPHGFRRVRALRILPLRVR